MARLIVPRGWNEAAKVVSIPAVRSAMSFASPCECVVCERGRYGSRMKCYVRRQGGSRRRSYGAPVGDYTLRVDPSRASLAAWFEREP
jgi:hypothetical protein